MRAFFRTLLVLLVLVPAVGIGVAVYLGKSINLHFFERTPPGIALKSTVKGIGTGKNVVAFELVDTGAGLDEVKVKVEQQGREKTVLVRSFPGPVKRETIEVPLNPKELELREGEVTVTVSVFDASFFSNGAQERFTLAADFQKPRLEVLTVQHNGTVAGALMVMYRILSDDTTGHGVRAGTRLTPGYSAKLLDPAFEAAPNLYFSIFPIPADLDPDRERFEVYAEDEAGNVGTSGFYQKIQKKRFRDAEMRLSREFFARSVEKLLPQYLEATGSPALTDDPFKMSEAQLVDAFKRVNEEYRALLGEKLRSITGNSMTERMWSGAFDKPMPSAPTATFMERRQYWLGDLPAGNSVHEGIDLAQTAQSVFRASNGGKVVFADSFGIYGNAVVLDHGFGLMTLYGHMSSTLVNVGDRVNKGDPLGRTGDTGLAGGDHLHFEVRLHGVPISPFEWLDGHWIKDHVDDQIKQIKSQLRIGVPTPAPSPAPAT
jgi:murein DD-endopeptidase MepM/ murein hydrolase activator NlpD